MELQAIKVRNLTWERLHPLQQPLVLTALMLLPA
jgi:hypothetical protein